MAEMLTKADLARRWGVSREMVGKIFRRPGAPSFSGRKIDAEVADAWRATGNADFVPPSSPSSALPDIAESRRRAEAYKTRLLELEVKKAEGELIPLAQAIDTAKSDASVIRSTLLAMPARLAPALADAGGSAVAISAILEQWARESLAAFARMMDGK